MHCILLEKTNSSSNNLKQAGLLNIKRWINRIIPKVILKYDLIFPWFENDFYKKSKEK